MQQIFWKDKFELCYYLQISFYSQVVCILKHTNKIMWNILKQK